MSTKLQTVSRLDLVWDTYLADSLIGSTRAKRGQGVRRRVVAAAAIPGNWQNFLRVDSSKKTELLRFLSAALMEWFNQEDKQLVIANGEAVLSKPVLPDLTSLPHLTMKKLTLGCCCMHLTQRSIDNMQYSSGL